MSNASRDGRTRTELLLELGKCQGRYARSLKKITLRSLELVQVETALSKLRASHAELLRRLEDEHSPFVHDYEKDERRCGVCRIIARAKALAGEGE